jgi:phosphopantothenoylcysteine synthetase/decarboxylase
MSTLPLTVIVCGAPLAARTPDLVAELHRHGWHVSVVGTPSSAAWLDHRAITQLTGEPPRLDLRSVVTERRVHPAAVVVCPATFNTINKAVAGANDTYALAVLCEALGSGVPILAVPMVNDRLWGHPAWASSLRVMKEAGVTLIDVVSGGVVPTAVESNAGERVAARFDPRWLSGHLARLVRRSGQPADEQFARHAASG